MLHILEGIPLVGPLVQVVLGIERGVVDGVLVVAAIARFLLGL